MQTDVNFPDQFARRLGRIYEDKFERASVRNDL